MLYNIIIKSKEVSPMKKVLVNVFLVGMVLFVWCWIANGGIFPTLMHFLSFSVDKITWLLSLLLRAAEWVGGLLSG